jgi:hypothetical protein
MVESTQLGGRIVAPRAPHTVQRVLVRSTPLLALSP